MSRAWSPSPKDFDGYEKYYQDLQTQKQSKTALNSELPSHRAMHTIGGTTLARRRLAGMRDSNQRPTQNGTHEVVNMTEFSMAETNGFAMVPSGAATGLAFNPLVDNLTYKDMELLKELPCSMSEKREIRERLLATAGDDQKGKSWHPSQNVKWRRFKEDARDLFRRMQLWNSAIHEIEGRFGSAIRSYFAFLRWLFILNIYIFVLIFIFIVVPTIAFESLNLVSSSNSTVPEACQYEPFNANAINSFSQYIIWWFTGQGFMEKTLLFCGYYDNSVTSIAANTSFTFHYNIPLAYLLIAFSYFILSLFLLVRRAAAGLKESLVSDEDRFYSYCNKVFAGWDFCICDPGSAELKHRSLLNEIEADLEDERMQSRRATRTQKEKAILYTKRVVINFVVILVLVGALVAIFFAADFALRNTSKYDDDFFLDLLVTYLVSIVITVVNLVAPVVFDVLILWEDYSPAYAIKFTLIRTVVLRLASIIFFYVVVYFQIHCDQFNIVDATVVNGCDFCSGTQCWETYIGQEMYKLTILDFFVILGVTLFVEFPRKLVVDNCGCKLAQTVGYQEFDVPKNVLEIVYAQTVLWIGAFYAPLLPVVVVIKFFIIFYLKKMTLLYNCKPAKRPYRASRTGTFFFLILLFGFFVAAVPVGVGIAVIKPSSDCGPFRSWTTMFEAVTRTVADFPTVLRDIFWFLGSAGFAVIFGVILCLVLYYYKSLNTAHTKMIRLLKDQLSLEGKDKQFLLQRVSELSEKLNRATGDNSTGRAV